VDLQLQLAFDNYSHAECEQLSTGRESPDVSQYVRLRVEARWQNIIAGDETA
jgi:hypothetical protein